MIAEIATALQSTLLAVQLDGSSLFTEVKAAPPKDNDDFADFPACSFYYDTTDSAYSTVSANRRDVEFSIWIYGIWQNKTLTDQYATMYAMIDAVLDALDNSNDLGIDTIIVRPVPAELNRVQIERGDGLMARIRLVCSGDMPANGS